MKNYNHRQLLTRAFVTLLCFLGAYSPGLADEVEILALPYTKVEVVDVSNDSISFVILSGKTIVKPLADVRRIMIDDFPLFSAAERLLYSDNHKDAVPVYQEALEGLEGRQKALLEKSSRLKKANKTEEAKRYDRRSKAKWPKKLFEFRLEQAKKGPKPKDAKKEFGQTKTDSVEVKTDPSKPVLCRLCKGTGLSKCSVCNGSGYTKCPHIDGKSKKHINWHEICRKCNGKGKLPKRLKKTYTYKNKKGKTYTRTKWITKYEPCPDCFDFLDQYGVKIYVTWVCAHCGNSQYKGYIKCTKCNNGKLTCEVCKGTGLRDKNPSSAPAVDSPKKPASQKK